MKKFFCNGKQDFCDDHEACPLECPYTSGTGGYYKEAIPTYADRIRAMTDEELEAFLIDVDLDKAGSPFITEWGKWLQQPAEE